MSDVSAATTPFGSFERSLAWRYLRARREHGGAALISIISFVGIALAVTALIVIMSIMSGFRATLLDTLLGGSGEVFAYVAEYDEETSDTFANEIRGLPGVDSVHGFHEGQVLITSGARSTGALVRSIDPEDLDIYEFRQGTKKQFINNGFGQGKNGGNVIILGKYVAAQLAVVEGSRVTLLAPNGKKTPFGVSPQKKEYVVGGIFATGNTELDQLYAFMPLEQGELFFSLANGYTALDIRVDDPMIAPQRRLELSKALGGAVYMEDWQQRRSALFNALQIERSMMRIIMLVLITITALNIITGVVMLVKNKTRDVAILRTIGASRGSIMRVFVMIGGVLGFLGALTGMVIGVTIVLNIGAVEWFLNTVLQTQVFDPEAYGLDGLPAILDWSEVLFTTGWAVGMSILVTLWPAWRAAKMDPVDALRFE